MSTTLQTESFEFRDDVEQVIASILAQPESSWTTAIEDACRSHPDSAGLIRRRMRHLFRSHMLDSKAMLAGVPKQLGEYQLLEELGGGGMGVVYLAQKTGSDKKVALKLVRPDFVLFSGARQRFAREVRTVSRLKHRGIVPVLDFGEVDGVPYFTMEWIQGCTLAEILDELRGVDPSGLDGRDFWAALLKQSGLDSEGEPSIPKVFHGTWWEVCLRMVEQVACTLSYAHEQGVLHRDVKPSNLMITPQGDALLLDFGLARSNKVSRMTQTGAALGSLPYMAPEQVNGEREVDGRVDTYSLAVTLFELLTLEPAFSGSNVERLRRKILEGEVENIRSLNLKVPVAAETVCRMAMAREAGQRYPAMAEFADDLVRVLQSQPVRAKADPWLRRSMQWVKRHPVLAGAVALLLLQAGTAQVVLMSNLRSEREQAARARTEALDARREMQRLRSQTETALLETRQLLDAALLYSLPLQAEDIALQSQHSSLSLENWLETAERLLARKEEILARIDHSKSAGEGRQDFQRVQDRFEMLETMTRNLRDEHDRLSSLQWRTLDSPEAKSAWQEATDDIFLLEAYGGLELEPIFGLYPLGTDPDSGFWEFGHLQSGEPPSRAVRGDDLSPWQITEQTGMVLVLVPGGSFQHLPYDSDSERSERVAVTVSVGSFLVSKYEVTQSQWARIDVNKDYRSAFTVGLEPSSAPVESVSWVECRDWLERAGLELPTEAQWEYACRGGSSARFPMGQDAVSLLGYANFADDSIRVELPLFESRWDDGFGFPAPVGSYLPNGFGLYDIVGNVAEFTLDAFQPAFSAELRAGDALREVASSEGEAVVRGGGWRDRLRDLASSSREARRTFVRFDDVGLRPVLNLHNDR